MKRKNVLPTITIVMATYNSMRTLSESLTSITRQDYPKEKIEIIVVDGGSTDNTRETAKKFGAHVIAVDKTKQNAEYNKSVGISKATGEIVGMIDHDNVLPHSGWLRKMTQPFLDDATIVGVETLRYGYDPNGALLDRYFALFGSGDPVVWYLGKSDRVSYMYDPKTYIRNATWRNGYCVMRYSVDTMPTIGANGYLIRRSLLKAYADIRPGRYFDMDVNIDLIKAGYDRFAFVDDSVYHKTGYGSIWYYFSRRMLFLRQYHISNVVSRGSYRRFHMVSRKNVWRLLITIIIILSLVIPFYESMRGWIKIRDKAWFLHPLMGFGFVIIYGWVIISHSFMRYANKILGTS